MTGEKTKPSRGELLDAAFRTAVDHVDHCKYQSEAEALRSLRRRCRGFSPTQYFNALRRAIELLGSVEEVIAPFQPPYDPREAEDGWSGFPEAARALQRRCPGFRLSTCGSAIGWVLFWRHWK
ncbi:MAG TPA: hypothetical protein VFT74_17130 [Isosphaeraceae bacterium]|nr:hypothetical protein [Isosphaeraceae bacterium]